MKKPSYLLIVVLVLTAVFISSCGGSAAVSAPNMSSFGGGSKPLAMPVEFTGVIESINGNQWSVNGQTITVDPAVVRDGPFNVGDTVKVEVQVQTDGSMVVSRVETPASIVAVVPSSSPDAPGTPDASLDVASAPDPVFNSTPEPALSSASLNSNEAFGTVTSINGNTIVIGGHTYQLANNAEIKNQIQSGASVKVHFILNADGTMTITEIQNLIPVQTMDNSSSDTSNNSGSNSGNHDLNHDNSGSNSGSHDHNDGSSSHDQSDDDPSHDQNDDNSGSD